MGFMNRIATSKNPYQGNYRRVLCVCSAGLLRSPTAAFVLSQEPFNCNTRCAGITQEFALVPVDDVLVAWADEIVCMDQEQADTINKFYKPKNAAISLGIPDNYEYRNPDLIKLIKEKYMELHGMKENE